MPAETWHALADRLAARMFHHAYCELHPEDSPAPGYCMPSTCGEPRAVECAECQDSPAIGHVCAACGRYAHDDPTVRPITTTDDADPTVRA